MSTHLGESEAGTYLTQFFGGEDRGLCIQITTTTPQPSGSVQLTVEDARWVFEGLAKWVKEQEPG